MPPKKITTFAEVDQRIAHERENLLANRTNIQTKLQEVAELISRDVRLRKRIFKLNRRKMTIAENGSDPDNSVLPAKESLELSTANLCAHDPLRVEGEVHASHYFVTAIFTGLEDQVDVRMAHDVGRRYQHVSCTLQLVIKPYITHLYPLSQCVLPQHVEHGDWCTRRYFIDNPPDPSLFKEDIQQIEAEDDKIVFECDGYHRVVFPHFTVTGAVKVMNDQSSAATGL
jgi:hypothetical protein